MYLIHKSGLSPQIDGLKPKYYQANINKKAIMNKLFDSNI